MSNHSNSTEAHAFYYNGVDKGDSKSYARCTLSYEGRNAYSYSTLVAKVIPAKGKKAGDIKTSDPDSGITLVSLYPMSSTTCRHISGLRGASPFEVIHVPMSRGHRWLEPRDVASNILKELEYYLDKLNLRENRSKFASLLSARNAIIERASSEWSAPLKNKAFAKFDNLDVDKYVKELKASNAKAAAKKAAEMRKVMATYMTGKTGPEYVEFIRAVFGYGYESQKYPISKEVRRDLSGKLTSGGKSFVWVEGDDLVTSKSVRVPVREAKVLMRMWAAGDDMRTQRISSYSVVKYEGGEIQIGCHHIPRENMLALYETLIGKKFPDKKEGDEQSEPEKEDKE